MTSQTPTFSVSDLLASINQTLEYAYPSVIVEGEVSSFKVNQSKYVFFDLKDEKGSINCFMTVWQLKMPIEDGMKVVINATPKITPWGKFSLTVQSIRPSGEGSLKKSYEILKNKLEEEGIFAEDRKRQLPILPSRIAVISSVQAAGYMDFIKILNDRWGGIKVDVAHVQVQGVDAPDQMIRALRYFNEQETLPELIVMVRGGGSADDLSAYNDEALVREIASSRVPVITGIGHETDESLSDLAADVRAITPSNAAQLIIPDRHDMIARLAAMRSGILSRMERIISKQQRDVSGLLEYAADRLESHSEDKISYVRQLRRVLAELNPDRVLERGYALIRGDVLKGSIIEIVRLKTVIRAEVKDVKNR